MSLLEDAQEFVINKWGTLNTAASPAQLPEGQSPNNQNVWMDEKPGSIVTANGYLKLGTLPSNLPVTGLINYFKAASGVSQLICTDGQNVYATTDYVTFTTVKTGLSAFFQLRGKVIRDKLWLTNGSDSVMTWDGATLTTLDGSGATPNVPKGKFLEYHDERVWLFGINGDLSSLRFSALADSSGTEIAPTSANAWPADNQIQVSEGDADIGTGIFLYRGYLYCSKQYSIWRITGYDEYTYTRTKTRSSTGTRFQESVAEKDDLVHFIGVDGLYVFDGETSKRISDIIDPASSEEGVFAFRNLQQPLLNNQFWNVTDAAGFNAGTVPANLDTSGDSILLKPADNTNAEFNAGSHSNTASVDDILQLDVVATGGGGSLVSTGKSASISGAALVGVATSMVDGAIGSYCGFLMTGDQQFVEFTIDLGSALAIGQVILKSFYMERKSSQGALSCQTAKIQYSTDNSTWNDATSISAITALNGTLGTSHGAGVSGESGASYSSAWRSSGPTDYTVNFSTVAARYWRFLFQGDQGQYILLKELEIYRSGYQSTGTFHSKSIDYSSTPATFGTLAAAITTNGETYQFFTQSSADGSTWDSNVNVSNGAAIGSTLRRYLRWGVTLNSSTGVSTPQIDKVYVGGTFLSDIHNTGGNIYSWSAFQSAFNKAGQTITFYYRAGANNAAVSAAAWTAIVPGAFPGAVVASDHIQIKIELSTTDATMAPEVDSFTVNWILNSGAGINTLQNVASIVILNRYWLAAATLGSAANDVVIVLGKSTFQSPWHKKDFAFLSFCRFQDYFIAGSSTDGSIYRLETGFSKNGSAMDSFYETADLQKEGFMFKGKELLVHCDRSGPYTLSVGFSTDGGLNYTEKTIDLTRATGEQLGIVKRLNISFMSPTVRFRVRINAADQPFSVDEMHCFYRTTPQRGTLVAA